MTDSRDEALKQLMDDFHASIDADRRLFRVDIRGSIAYARGLVRIDGFPLESEIREEVGINGLVPGDPSDLGEGSSLYSTRVDLAPVD